MVLKNRKFASCHNIWLKIIKENIKIINFFYVKNVEKIIYFIRKSLYAVLKSSARWHCWRKNEGSNLLGFNRLTLCNVLAQWMPLEINLEKILKFTYNECYSQSKVHELFPIRHLGRKFGEIMEHMNTCYKEKIYKGIILIFENFFKFFLNFFKFFLFLFFYYLNFQISFFEKRMVMINE